MQAGTSSEVQLRGATDLESSHAERGCANNLTHLSRLGIVTTHGGSIGSESFITRQHQQPPAYAWKSMAAQQTLNGAQNHGSFHLQVERDCRPNHQPIQKIVSPLDPQYDANQHHSQSHAYDGPQKRSTGGDDGKVHKRYKSSPHETNAHPTNALLMLAEATSDVQNANEHTTYYPATFLMAAQESSVAAAESSDEADSDWNANYELLEAFHAKYGHVVVPEGWKDNPELYQWAELQRQEGWKRLCGQPELSSLTDQQMMKLHRLGFAWTAPETWDDMLAKVQAFYRKKGHANVSSTNRVSSCSK